MSKAIKTLDDLPDDVLDIIYRKKEALEETEEEIEAVLDDMLERVELYFLKEKTGFCSFEESQAWGWYPDEDSSDESSSDEDESP